MSYEKVIELSSEDADKIYQSDRTNDIYIEITLLINKFFILCKEGIEIKLDPTCVTAFEKAKDEV